MTLLRRHWANMSIHYKAVALCCTFVVPILIAVGILIFEFSAYRLETDRILSEYAGCIDYANALRTESELLDALPFAAANAKSVDEYTAACEATSTAWQALAPTQTTDNAQIDLLKQVIGRAMNSLHERQQQFLDDFAAGIFDATAFSHCSSRARICTAMPTR